MKKIISCISSTMAALLCLGLISCSAPADNTDTDTVTLAGSETETQTEPESTDAPAPAVPVITEESGAAAVTVGDLAYKASGYAKLEDGKFRFRSGFSAEFSGITGKFNRMTFRYTSTDPLKLTVNYKTDTSERSDLYYLDASDDGVFSCFIYQYNDAVLATELLSVNAESCSGAAASFLLTGVETEERELLTKSTYYIENSRFKVGVSVRWGGGINYVEDKTCKVRGLSNLVNRHDTGRLIQQSYYGTAGNDEYQPEVSMGSMWVYNPVQGGDQHNNPSRLIDLEMTETSIYIKAQPLDWSKNNYHTPTYMENTYSITDDVIRVDNRFTDYSGWEHRYASQELPALYTVSYLSRFTWYDGAKPWQDGELSYKDDLNFWGDQNYVADCTMKMKYGNTETWCAWTNPDDDFGLGLFVPNIDVFKAGRYEFDGTKKDKDNPTNYVAPLNIIKINSYKPIEYSYLMTTGSVADIRATFMRYKDFTDNASLHNDYQPNRVYGGDKEMTDASFETAADIVMISTPHNTEISFSSEQTAAVLKVDGADPSVTFDYTKQGCDSAEKTKLTFEYMIPTENSMKSYETDLFLCTGAQKVPSGDCRVRQRLICDGQYHTLELDLSKYSFWNGTINQIRFDYFDNCAAGDVMYLRSFKLS